ncbi:unnamed protein product [Owenia fusiformis]|uniref:BRICHOS domain-containing protein n=1 Tax=Owenia fusiformis TaxID=6347 RepID=A0A8S4NQB4_OWEFU|nr:unnamed protein product [Owenia fusiformis]
MKPDLSVQKEVKGDVQILTSGLVMPQPTPSIAPKRNGTKYVCVAVTVVLVVSMVIGGFFGALYMMHHTTLKTVETTINAAGRHMKEKIQIDENKETATLEGIDDQTQYMLIMDYKHGLSISRIWMNGSEPRCFVAHLDKTGFPTIQEMARYLEKQPADPEFESSFDPTRQSFSVDIDPIEDISFLGDEVEAMCKGLQAYWAHPRNPSKQGKALMRQKRDDNDEEDMFYPNVTRDCPLPEYGFLLCNQDTEESCNYKCCKNYFCFRFYDLNEEEIWTIQTIYGHQAKNDTYYGQRTLRSTDTFNIDHREQSKDNTNHG